MTDQAVARRQTVMGAKWAVAILLALLLAGCSKPGAGGEGKGKQQSSVNAATAEVRALAHRLELTGTIEATRVARMASPVEGPVIAFPVREGDEVKPGQLLARLGRARGDDAVAASAKAELERQEQDLSRIEKLVKTGAFPGEKLDEARVKVTEAQARLARALERLGDYRVSAPWSGVVSKVHVTQGEFVSAHAILVELFQPESLVLRFAVPEDSAARVRSDAPIAVTLDAHPGATFAARVARVYPDIDRRTHTRTVEAVIDGDIALAPGMFARLKLTLASVPDALTVPAGAVVRRGESPVVYVIASDGVAKQRKVELGMEDEGRVQIVAGLEPGERVAVGGHNRLRDGKKVRVADAKEGKGHRAEPRASEGKGKTR
ncbi:MAG: efflux RND transporter periplasmic adaptor subunit [Polyangiaceae bacterium]|nr:efflux RND transporter periplasmic adaptor subunit [Polyangiaceae bacterium]